MENELLTKLGQHGWKYKWVMYKDVFEYWQQFNNIESPSISVIVISWRLHKDTIKNFMELEKQRRQNYELIFVDNGGKDGEFDCLKPYIDTYIKLNKNTGAYLARNLGALFAKAPILLFLEDDGIPDIDLIESHIEAHNCFDIIAVRGVYLFKTNNPYNNRQTHYYMSENIFPSYSNLEGNSSYNSKMFYKVGGWDDNIKFGGGGIDLAIRLLEVEPDMTKQIYSPAAVIYHDYVKDEIHLKVKSKKQQESLKRLKEIHPKWNEYIKTWKEYRSKSHLVKRLRNEESFIKILDRVMKRNFWKIKSTSNGVLSIYDKTALIDINNISQKFEYRVIFGAGKYGLQVLNVFKKENITINFFTDNDDKKWGKRLEGIEILNPNILNDNFFIFIASDWFYDIADQLEEMNLKKNVNYVVVTI